MFVVATYLGKYSAIISKTPLTVTLHGTTDTDHGLQRAFDDRLRRITYIGSYVEARVRCRLYQLPRFPPLKPRTQPQITYTDRVLYEVSAASWWTSNTARARTAYSREKKVSEG